MVTLILFMVLMNLAMSLYRSPTVSLMPDITEEKKRTRANGIINFMAALAPYLPLVSVLCSIIRTPRCHLLLQGS